NFDSQTDVAGDMTDREFRQYASSQYGFSGTHMVVNDAGDVLGQLNFGQNVNSNTHRLMPYQESASAALADDAGRALVDVKNFTSETQLVNFFSTMRKMTTEDLTNSGLMTKVMTDLGIVPGGATFYDQLGIIVGSWAKV